MSDTATTFGEDGQAANEIKPRGYTVTTTFEMYLDEDGDTHPAAHITENDLEQVRQYWEKPDAVIGDFIILQPNGDGILLKAAAFLEIYTKKFAQV